ncbi:DUF4393 domain-containing protein [Providencia alcalifaciens]|uniref:DUF4393 domain-containing protein n=1 Tax=Providencia alcalifaciens TaxID=126385 RepID=UPI0032DA002A
MSESDKKKSSNNFTQSATGLAVDLIKSVPVSDDAKNKAGDEIGKTLVTLTKAINVALTPVSLTIFGYERIKDFVSVTLKDKLKKVPEENIVPPKGNIVGPALENLKYLEDTPDELSLKNMYANLIANSINKDTKDIIHPAFVDIIKQLDHKDILILEEMRNQKLIGFISIKRKHEDIKQGKSIVFNFLLNNKFNATVNFDGEMLNSALENFERLKIIKIREGEYYTNNAIYDEISNESTYKHAKEKLGEFFEESKGMIEITTLGQRFLKVCTD